MATLSRRRYIFAAALVLSLLSGCVVPPLGPGPGPGPGPAPLPLPIHPPLPLAGPAAGSPMLPGR
jgi:hypothetical protein